MRDVVEITSSRGTFDRFTSVEIFNSILRSSEASFEVGDDGSWDSLSRVMAIGEAFQVSVNGHARVTGRIEVLSTDLSAGQSSTIRFVVRTVTADLEYTECDPSIRVKNASIRDVVEQAINKSGIRSPTVDKIEIEWRGDVARRIMTGKAAGRGDKKLRELKPLTDQQAAPQPGETIKQFLDRHLIRHGLMVWDSPDGKLVVGEPDDQQEPTYRFRIFRGAEARYNNCRQVTRSRDVTGVPTELTVYGWAGGGDYRRSKVHSLIRNDELRAAGFARRVGIVDEGVKTKQQAERTAERAYAERVRKSDSITVETDGFSHRAAELYDYAPDTTADVALETMGGVVGIYYVESTMLRQTPQGGQVSQIELTRQGVWRLT